MFAFASLVALASAALPQVLAHGGVLSYKIGGQIFQGWAVSRLTPPSSSRRHPWSEWPLLAEQTPSIFWAPSCF